MVETKYEAPYQSVGEERCQNFQERIKWFGKRLNFQDDLGKEIYVPENILKKLVPRHYIQGK